MAFQVGHNSKRSIILQIHELKSKKTWLEAYRNSYLHFIYPWAAVALYTHTQAAVALYTHHTHTHTNTLPYTSLAHAHRGIALKTLFGTASTGQHSCISCEGSNHGDPIICTSCTWHCLAAPSLFLRLSTARAMCAGHFTASADTFHCLLYELVANKQTVAGFLAHTCVWRWYNFFWSAIKFYFGSKLSSY